MFLKKLFKFGKDYNHYLEKGDRYLADERFADARNAYGEALEKIEASGEATPSRIEDRASKNRADRQHAGPPEPGRGGICPFQR